MSETNPAIQVNSISVTFRHASTFLSFGKTKSFNALSDVSFSLGTGSCLGIVGESGSGKTMLAKAILGLIEPSTGTVGFDHNLEPRKDIQFIFQDPLAALNPRLTVEQLITEPLDYLNDTPDTQTRINKLRTIMEQVGLDFSQRYRYAHEFSGGQCQRIGIARAMITEPKILICDEPVSALDVSVRAQIINLLKDLQQRLGLTLIFIAHDLSLVRFISDKLLVLYQGKLMETGPTEELFQHTRHPYTQALISAEPRPDPNTERQRPHVNYGEAIDSTEPQIGCSYAKRCSYAQERCHEQEPQLTAITDAVKVACFFPLEQTTSV